MKIWCPVKHNIKQKFGSNSMSLRMFWKVTGEALCVICMKRPRTMGVVHGNTYVYSLNYNWLILLESIVVFVKTVLETFKLVLVVLFAQKPSPIKLPFSFDTYFAFRFCWLSFLELLWRSLRVLFTRLCRIWIRRCFCTRVQTSISISRPCRFAKVVNRWYNKVPKNIFNFVCIIFWKTRCSIGKTPVFVSSSRKSYRNTVDYKVLSPEATNKTTVPI